jgi:hypothetical protein
VKDSAVEHGRTVGQAIGTVGFIAAIVFVVYYVRQRRNYAIPPESATTPTRDAEALKPTRRGRFRSRQRRLDQTEQGPEPPHG